MTKVTYQIVEHDGGWAYRVDGTYSETFASHDEAAKAARKAAGEQRVGGESAAITWEDEKGQWREELVDGGDRPETTVED